MDAGERAQASFLAGRGEMQLDERAHHFRALAVVEQLGAGDEVSPTVEPGAHRQQQLAAPAERTRLAQREEAMVLVRHELLVQSPRGRETRAAARSVDVPESRVALLERMT